MVVDVGGKQSAKQITVEYEGRECVVTDINIRCHEEFLAWWYRDDYNYYPEDLDFDGEWDEDAQKYPRDFEKWIVDYYSTVNPGVDVTCEVHTDPCDNPEGNMDVMLDVVDSDGNFYEIELENNGMGFEYDYKEFVSHNDDVWHQNPEVEDE